MNYQDIIKETALALELDRCVTMSLERKKTCTIENRIKIKLVELTTYAYVHTNHLRVTKYLLRIEILKGSNG